MLPTPTPEPLPFTRQPPTLVLPEAPLETGPTVPFPINPVWRSLMTHAETGLSKIHAGLNIAGQTELAVTGNVLPSVYRYSVLVERAKVLVAIAQQVESAYLAALERLDAAANAMAQAQLAGAATFVTADTLLACD